MNRWPITEAALMDDIADLAKRNGWMVAHFRPAGGGRQGWRTPVQYDAKGFPDLVLVSGDRRGVLFVEVKGEDRNGKRGRLTPEERMWLLELSRSGVTAATWGPDEWRSGHIERVLRDEAQESGA